MLSPIFVFLLGLSISLNNIISYHKLCFGGFVIFSMKSVTRVRLEPTTSIPLLTARRAAHLRHKGWRAVH